MDYKELEVKNFHLYYDGTFCIEFKHKGREYSERPYLDMKSIYKIFQNEGFTDAHPLGGNYYDKIEVKNSTLVLSIYEENKDGLSFVTSEMADLYQDNNIYIIECYVK